MLTLIAASNLEPVTLAEAKQHLQTNIDDHDGYIIALISAARQFCENETGCSFACQSWGEWFSSFPSGPIELTKYPVTEIVSVTYQVENNPLALDPASYIAVLPTTGIARLYPVAGWPGVSNRPDAVQIVYKTQRTFQIELIKAAIKLLVGTWYEQRADESTATTSPISLGVQRILSGFDARGYY